MQKYQYETCDSQWSLGPSELDKWGADGWELVGFVLQSQNENHVRDTFHYIFKRPIA